MRRIYICLSIGFLALFSLFGDASMSGAVRGLELFAHGVFPALFPFTVCICCLKKLGFFDVQADGSFFAMARLFFLGAAAGNPTGSMLIGEAGCEGSAEGLLPRSVYSALFNLASPVFISGAVCSRIFSYRTAAPAVLIMLCHYGSAFIVFCAYFAMQKRSSSKKRANQALVREHLRSCGLAISKESVGLSSVFPSALMDAVSTMLKLCGTIVFFVSLTEILLKSSMLDNTSGAVGALITGTLEMTNGLSILAKAAVDTRLSLSLACSMLSFGGICIFMQANAVSRVQPLAYLGTKLLHGLLSALLCCLLFPLFIDESISVINESGVQRLTARAISSLQIALLCFIASIAASLAAILAARRTKA